MKYLLILLFLLIPNISYSGSGSCREILTVLGGRGIQLQCREVLTEKTKILWYMLSVVKVRTNLTPEDILSLILIITNYYIETTESQHEGIYIVSGKDVNDYLAFRVRDIQMCKSLFSTNKEIFTGCVAQAAVLSDE